jgi:hypothetical protein
MSNLPSLSWTSEDESQVFGYFRNEHGCARATFEAPDGRPLQV